MFIFLNHYPSAIFNTYINVLATHKLSSKLKYFGISFFYMGFKYIHKKSAISAKLENLSIAIYN